YTHGVWADPILKNRPPDFIDAEKVYVEACAALVLGATAWRFRRRRGPRGWSAAGRARAGSSGTRRDTSRIRPRGAPCSARRLGALIRGTARSRPRCRAARA